MSSQDLHNKIKTSVGLDIAAITTDTTTNGNIIDTQGFESLEYILVSATITDGDYVPAMVHGDAANLSDAAAVPTDFIVGSYADASFTEDTDDNQTRRVGYVAHKRYVRLDIASTSTTSGGTLGAIAVLSNAHHQPTAEDAA